MPGDKIEIPVWLIPKTDKLDKVIKKGMKMPAYIMGESRPSGERKRTEKRTGERAGTGWTVRGDFRSSPAYQSMTQGKPKEIPTQSPMAKFLKLYKFDLFWKWLKGTWNTLVKMSPLVSGLASAFSSAIGLLFTALVLPFLGDIVNFLKFIFDVAGKILSFAINFGPDIREGVIAGLGVLMANPAFLLKVIEWFAKLSITLGEYIPYVEKLSGVFKFLGTIVEILHGWFNKVIATVVELASKLGGEGLGLAVKGIIGTFLRLANIAMWVSLIADILKLIVGAIFGKDNPIYALLDLISSLTDVVGLLIAGFKDLLAVFGIGKGGALAGFAGDIVTKATEFRKQIGLAEGGVVTSPTSAVIGDDGPEAVIPLDKMKGMGTTISVSGIVDERRFRDIIQSVVNQSLQRTNSVRGSAF